MALAARSATRAALAAEAAAPAPRDCSSWALACLALAARGDLMDCLLQGGAVVSHHALELLSAPCIEYESIQMHDEVYDLSRHAVGGEERGVQMALVRLRLRQTVWSTATHQGFPPAFKAAARTLLLASHRGAAVTCAPRALQGRKPSASSAKRARLLLLLGRLPQPALHAVVAAALRPLSAWERMVTA